jgi:hypothetical protein
MIGSGKRDGVIGPRSSVQAKLLDNPLSQHLTKPPVMRNRDMLFPIREDLMLPMSG